MWFLLFEISQNLEELASIAAFIEFLNSIYLPNTIIHVKRFQISDL